MSSRLKSTDLPKPWFSSSKGKGKNARQKMFLATASVVRNNNPEDVREQNRTWGRKLAEATPKGGNLGKQKQRGKSVSASAFDASLPIPENVGADVEELCRKREEDAAACGRTMKTIFKSGK